MLYKLLKQSMVASTHIENFLKTPEHKLLEKTNTVRKLELQTFVLITLYSDRWRHHVCVLRSKAHDLLGTSLAAKGPGIVNLVIATTYSETRLPIQDGGRYEPNLLAAFFRTFWNSCVVFLHLTKVTLFFQKLFVCVVCSWRDFHLLISLKFPHVRRKVSFCGTTYIGSSNLSLIGFDCEKTLLPLFYIHFPRISRLSWLWLRVCLYLTVWILLLLQSGLWWIKVTLVCTVLEGRDLDTVMLWQVCFQILKKLQNILRAEVFWLVQLYC